MTEWGFLGARAGQLDAASFLAVYATLLFAIPSQLIFRPLGAAGTPAAVWGMLGLLWWICCRAGGLIGNERSPVRWALLAFACCILASYANGMAHGWYSPSNIQGVTDDLYDLVPASLEEIRAKMMTAADRGLLGLMTWAGVVLVSVDGLRSWRQLDRVVGWLVKLAAVVALVGIIQFFTGLQIERLYHIPGLSANEDFGAVLGRSVLRRVQATASHPIEFGVVMAAMFPLALHRALHAGRRIAWVAPGLVGASATMSVSRSAILTLGVGGVVLLAGWPRVWRVNALTVAPFLVVGLRLLIPGLVGTIISLWTNLSNDPSTAGRTGDYTVVLGLYTDHPFLGRGHLTFVPRYYRIVDNQILVSLVELGAVGLFAMLTLFATAYLCARGVRLRASTSEHRHLGLALAASLAGLVVSFATFDAFGFPMVAGLTFLLIGLAGAAWQAARREQELGAAAESSTASDNHAMSAAG